MLHDKTDTVSTKQFAILLFVAGTAGKLFSLPAAFVKSGGRSAWLALAICLAVDLLMLGFFLVAVKKNPDKTAYELVCLRCGKIVAKILFGAVVLFLLIKALSLTLMVADFAAKELFMGVPPVVMLLPLCIVLYSFGVGGFRAIGRTAEIMIYFVVASLLVIILLTYQSADITKMMPPFGEGSVTQPLIRFPFLACGDYTALYLILGRIKRTKHFTIATVSSAVASSVAVAVFSVLTFAALMNLSTITPDTVTTVVTRTSATRLAFGRIDKLALAVFSIAPILTVGLFVRATVMSLQDVVGIQCPIKRAGGTALAVFVAALVLGEAGMVDFVTRYGVYFAPVFIVGIPLFLWILSLLKPKGASYENGQ